MTYTNTLQKVLFLYTVIPVINVNKPKTTTYTAF